MFTSSVRAQWGVHLLDVTNTIDNHTKAEEALDFRTVDGDPVVVESEAVDVYDFVDLGGGGGTFPDTMPYPNGVADTSMSDFVLRATADVTIPAGTWTIGFGSDDGGQLTIPGAVFDFADTFNNDSVDDDQIRYEGNRGHNWTTGVFTVDAPLTTTITASMHERGGGDSFEIAVIDDEDPGVAPDPGFGWELLGNGAFGWSVSTDAVPASLVAGRGQIGQQIVSGTRQNEVLGPAGEVTPGLTQLWFQGSNPGSKEGVDDVFDNEVPMVPAFKAGHGSSWWTGNESANSPILEGLVQYPAEVQPPLNAGNNDNYMAKLTGEIRIPESGTYRFTDGVDDYTYFAIDIDKSGEAGDSPDEVLIDDNAWTSVLRMDNSGGGQIGEADIAVDQGGEWLAVEFDMAEGGGDDAGIIYWDYDTVGNGGIGGAAGFPEFDDSPIVKEDADQLYIPDAFLRSAGPPPLLSADVVGALDNEKAIEFDVNGDTDEADKLVMQNPNPEVFTSILDLNDATFRIVGTGSLAPGDSFQIVEADQISGNVTIDSADAGQAWSFNPSTGMLTFGASDALQAGDADMNGSFDQLDLVKVQIAAKYLTGQPATWGDGDWNAAPGGSVSGKTPPQGDGLFNQLDIIAALNNGLYLQGPYIAIAKGGTEGDGQTSVIYNAGTGEVSVDAPAGTDLTSINIDSAAGIFTGAPAENLGGSFDNDADNNVFKATFGGSFGSLSFGAVAQAGLSEDFVANDLTVVGSLAGGGDLGNVDLIYVPEPSTMLLLGLGLLGALLLRRRS